MSEPPIDYPDDEPGNGPAPGQNPPHYPQYPQYPPQYPQYPPQYPQYGYPAPNVPNPNAISVGGVIGGVFMFPVLNFVIGFGTVMLADQGKVLLGFGAALLALVAFGGGFALWKTGSPVPKGLGLGLMIGWALTSILTVGYCTGLNPTMYT
ncbi:hypothetical protein [Mycolicibacterium phocaicum]|uniref:hypothetical protein n=1 Tax=Mycolicibacterium phocaicum TaxID=319706 RepID=UPI001CFA0C04|nr:hypothetical protein [Mycolicibacterium phocaicum]UCZ59140.1 hypothetical protein LHJ73_20705 [Mycolicibacterium phocaicum]